MRLEDKVALITGASTGIGAQIARRFAAEGASVVLASRNLERLQSVVDEIRANGGKACAARMDQTDESQVVGAVETCLSTFGRITTLVNNAGPVDLLTTGQDGPVHKISTEGWDKIISATLHGPFWCCKHAITAMLESGGGSIVNVSSIAAIQGLPHLAAYSASKGGLSALTRSIAIDYGQCGIRANGIITGFIVHENSQVAVSTPELMAAAKDRHLTRLGHPDDIANTAIYLASDESGFLTGTHITVDGGATVKSGASLPV